MLFIAVLALEVARRGGGQGNNAKLFPLFSIPVSKILKGHFLFF
jgi:hypothetical protein